MSFNEEKIDPRIIRTRSLILQAFKEILAEKNFENISVLDITSKAKINRTTFYMHFQDKYALLDHWIGQLVRDDIEKITPICNQYTPENLRNLISMACGSLTCMRNECVKPNQQFESLVEGSFKKQIFNLLSHWLERSTPDTSAELSATIVTSAIYDLASHYSHMKKRPALEKFVDEAFPLVAVNLEKFA